jgi:large repetitive protein
MCLWLPQPTDVFPLVNDTTGDTVDPATLKLIDPITMLPDVDGIVVVPNQGTWTLSPGGTVTFDPIDGFVSTPTPLAYQVSDNDGNPTTAIITLVAPPIANNDQDLANPIQTVGSVNLLDDDLLGNGSTNPAPSLVTIDLDPDTMGDQSTLNVPGQGDWAYVNGTVTFTPEPTFNGDPTPIPYTLTEISTGLSDPAIITMDYVPVAVNDVKTIVDPSLPTDVSPLDNDTGGDLIDPISLKLIDPATGLPDPDGIVSVPGQGVWTINPDGSVTFDPNDGFIVAPSPINYQVADDG